jgi:hypothetical protein
VIFSQWSQIWNSSTAKVVTRFKALVRVRQVMSATETLQAVITNPDFHDYLAILKGARNGFVYGVKVRFPHALIMAILFGRGE